VIQFTRAKRKVLVAGYSADAALLDALASYAREHDWHLITDMLSTGAFPQGWRGDGAIAMVSYDPELLTQIASIGVPTVAITSTNEPVSLPRVEDDHYEIGRAAAEHLLSRAHRNFAWAPLVDDRPNRERHRGFQSRLAEQGLGCVALPTAHAWAGLSWQCRWNEYRRRLAGDIHRLPRPTAIFAFNDAVAANLVDACRDLDIAVPEELAIIGVGNDALVRAALPVPLSTVELDHDGKARVAGEMLDSLMQGRPVLANAMRVAPRGVITRRSTDFSAVADPRVARALAYITDNYPNPLLSVADVADAAGVSRRQLERDFRAATGCSIREHIARTRMQEASRLLTTHPRVKITEIAELAGFAGAGNFFRTFRQFYGMSPHAHRARAVRELSVTAASGPAEPALLEREIVSA